jgi:RNA polymerase sigma-70 factor (ECF subfamily)
MLATIATPASADADQPAPLRSSLSDAEFKTLLVQLIPHLRAFAYSIAPRPEAEDLAQEAMVRAWKARASFQPDSNFKGWIFTILRNEQFSRARRSWRTQPLDPEVAENTLVSNDDPTAREDLLDVRNAMQELNFEQRQALALVGAAGLSYAETAVICDCAIGTVKSRVSRARSELASILERRRFTARVKTGVSASQAFDTIMAETVAMQLPNAQRDNAA